jgi:PII-like signaling protein
MRAPCDATLLRIFVGYDDVFDGKPLYDQIVHNPTSAVRGTREHESRRNAGLVQSRVNL